MSVNFLVQEEQDLYYYFIDDIDFSASGSWISFSRELEEILSSKERMVEDIFVWAKNWPPHHRDCYFRRLPQDISENDIAVFAGGMSWGIVLLVKDISI